MTLPERVEKLAWDTVSQSKTMTQIRLDSVNVIDPPLMTPKTDGLRVGGCIVLEYLRKGYAASVPEAGREHDDGR
jgi:hypothetical protein